MTKYSDKVRCYLVWRYGITDSNKENSPRELREL